MLHFWRRVVNLKEMCILDTVKHSKQMMHGHYHTWSCILSLSELDIPSRECYFIGTLGWVPMLSLWWLLKLCLFWWAFICQQCSILVFTWSPRVRLSTSPVSQRMYSNTDSVHCGLPMSSVCLEFSCPIVSRGWLLIIKVSTQLLSSQRIVVYL